MKLTLIPFAKTLICKLNKKVCGHPVFKKPLDFMAKQKISKSRKQCIPQSVYNKKKCNICDDTKYYITYDGYYNSCRRCNCNPDVKVF